MNEVRDWMQNKAKVSAEDTEDFVNDLIDHRIKLRPAEKARYERERVILLKQVRQGKK